MKNFSSRAGQSLFWSSSNCTRIGQRSRAAQPVGELLLRFYAFRLAFFPDAASTMAGQVDALFFFLLGVTVFFSRSIAWRSRRAISTPWMSRRRRRS